MLHTIARNAADGGYTKKFVARNDAEVGQDSTAAILRAGQQILGWIHDAIQPLRAILHRVSRPLDNVSGKKTSHENRLIPQYQRQDEVDTFSTLTQSNSLIG